MAVLSHIPKWIKSKYFIATLAFFVWMFFFDRNDITLQWKRISDLRKLQQSDKNMQKQISEARKELDLLKTNPFTLEKYAREKYLMKKDNEDIFIFRNKN